MKKTFWKEFISIFSWNEIKKGLITVTLVFMIILIFYMMSSLGVIK